MKPAINKHFVNKFQDVSSIQAPNNLILKFLKTHIPCQTC